MAARHTAAPSTRDRLLKSREAAEYLGRSTGTLANWRCMGRGPRFVGSGSGVRYRLSDLDAYIEAETHTSTR